MKKEETKIQKLLAKWRKLDDDLSSFERLEAMRKLVAQGDISHGAYDTLHTLAVSRATGKKAPVVNTQLYVEQPIMAGFLFQRNSAKSSWRKRYVVVFQERLEYRASSKASDAPSAASTATSTDDCLVLNDKFFVSDAASRRLKNDKPNSFMVSDFKITHYFAAETPELKQYWMHTIARAVRKIEEAKQVGYFFGGGVRKNGGRADAVFARKVLRPPAGLERDEADWKYD